MSPDIRADLEQLLANLTADITSATTRADHIRLSARANELRSILSRHS